MKDTRAGQALPQIRMAIEERKMRKFLKQVAMVFTTAVIAVFAWVGMVILWTLLWA